MQLSGSIALNLRCAVESAKRLRGKRVYPDTVKFWRDLIALAVHEQQRAPQGDGWLIRELVAKLEREISESTVPAAR